MFMEEEGMLAWWLKLMPYILVERLAKTRCERVDAVPGYSSSNPFKGIIFSWKKDTTHDR